MGPGFNLLIALALLAPEFVGTVMPETAGVNQVLLAQG